MYYCPNCKKKYSHYRHKCPECGTPCVPWDNRGTVLIVWIVILSILLLALLVFAFIGLESFLPTDGTSAPVTTSSQTSPTTGSTSSTAPTSSSTTAPTAPSVPPSTAPVTKPSTGGDVTTGIGMYTRAELEALSNQSFGYGPGPNRENLNFRPEYAVAEQKKYGKYGANFIAPDNGNIYLTFDCGYEYYHNGVPVTRMILDTLKEKNAKGVFFVTMDYVKKQPDLVRRMINEGHIVGNHSTTHPDMTTLSIDKMEQEVMTLHKYVLEHFDYTMTLFRPPTGQFSVRSLAVVQNLGYKTVHWSFSYADFTPSNQPDVAKSLENVLNKAHSGAIYLLHAVSVTNATLLGDAIDGFREKGFNIELFQ